MKKVFGVFFITICLLPFYCFADSSTQAKQENSFAALFSSDQGLAPDEGAGDGRFPKGTFIVEPDVVSLELAKKIQGDPEFEKIRSLNARENDFNIARRVGFFDIGGGSCSGFLVGPDLFLTNHHCVYDEAEEKMKPIDPFKIYMDYLDDDRKGGVTSRVTKLLATDERLDFALLKLSQPLGAQLGWLMLGSSGAEKNNAVKVIQHPQGRSKEISRKKSKIVKETREVLHYLADTEGGSSGSPVFALNGTTVIALHHVGSKNYNEGVRMDRIIPHISKFLWSPSMRTDPQPDSGDSNLSDIDTPSSQDDDVLQTFQRLLNNSN